MTSKHLSSLKPEPLNIVKGVHTSLRDLMALEHKATGFSFLPKQPIHSLLSGRHASRLRGRGLNFEDIRQYRMGDDIRTMDWRVTARTQTPHVRVYSEERDRPVYLIIDQRVSMFFGSVMNTKSVTASEIGGLAAWRVFGLGDRVGGCVFNDSEYHSVKPNHSRNTLQSLLSQIARFNQSLSAQQTLSSPEKLNAALELGQQYLKHDGLCCVISDGMGFDETTEQLLAKIASKNDVLWGQVIDPLELKLPKQGEFVAGDGIAQLQVNLNNQKLRDHYESYGEKSKKQFTQKLKKLGIPVLVFSTDQSVEQQLRAQLGYTPKFRNRQAKK